MFMTQSVAQPDDAGMTEAAVAAQVLAGLFTEAGRADPYPLYRRLHALGPVVAAPDGSLMVSGYELLSALLRDHRLMKMPERMLLASGYPDWQARPSADPASPCTVTSACLFRPAEVADLMPPPISREGPTR
jgi:cytochrome P450